MQSSPLPSYVVIAAWGMRPPRVNPKPCEGTLDLAVTLKASPLLFVSPPEVYVCDEGIRMWIVS